MLTSKRQYLNFKDEEAKASADIVYNMYDINDASLEKYSELTKSFEEYNKNREETINAYFEQIKKSAVEYAKNTETDSEEDLRLRMEFNSYIVRCDGNVFSFHSFDKAFQPNRYNFASAETRNFDTATGKLLTINDVVSDKDALISHLKQELVNQYPDAEFTDLDAYFAKKLRFTAGERTPRTVMERTIISLSRR